MKTFFSFLFVALVSLGLSDPAYCAFSFDGYTPESDKSIEYLGMIFGNIHSSFNGAALPLTPLVGSLFKIFNITVLSLGSMVVSYTIIISTINTAQEGEIMGRKWSSMWIPLRCSIGMACLLPSVSGYSLIQILMMKFVLMGVDAANYMWAMAVKNIDPPNKIHKIIDQSKIQATTESMLKGMVCAHALNHDPVCQEAIHHQTVTYYQKENKLHIGVAHDPRYQNICGTFTPSAPPLYADASTWLQTNLLALEKLAYSLQVAAEEIFKHDDRATMNHLWLLEPAQAALRQSLENVPLYQDADKKITNSNLEFGWLMAGSFYFEFAANKERTLHYLAPSAVHPGTQIIGDEANKQLNLYKARADEYIYFSHAKQKGDSVSNIMSSIGSSLFSWSAISDIWGVISNKFSETTSQILMLFNSPTFLTSGDSDPISNLRAWGNLITSSTETLFTTVTLTCLALISITCVGGGFFANLNPICTTVSTVVSMIFPLLMILISILWAAGITLSIYVPLIPYLIFTFTALSWFVLVIEALVAAPVAALGLVSPAQEVLGKASPAVMIIASVFLRPSLMILGFIIGITLVKASVTMINFGFESALQAILPAPDILQTMTNGSIDTLSIGGIGIFKSMVLICLYSGFVIMIIHECFSLIYVLPDKIIRWIGHAAEQSSVRTSVQEVKESTEKGAETSSGIMKGVFDQWQEKLKEKMRTEEEYKSKQNTTSQQNIHLGTENTSTSDATN